MIPYRAMTGEGIGAWGSATTTTGGGGGAGGGRPRENNGRSREPERLFSDQRAIGLAKFSVSSAVAAVGTLDAKTRADNPASRQAVKKNGENITMTFFAIGRAGSVSLAAADPRCCAEPKTDGSPRTPRRHRAFRFRGYREWLATRGRSRRGSPPSESCQADRRAPAPRPPKIQERPSDRSQRVRHKSATVPRRDHGWTHRER